MNVLQHRLHRASIRYVTLAGDVEYNDFMSRFPAFVLFALCAGVMAFSPGVRADDEAPPPAEPAAEPAEPPAEPPPRAEPAAPPSDATSDDNAVAVPHRHPVKRRPPPDDGSSDGSASADAPASPPRSSSGAPRQGQYLSRRIQVFLVPIGATTESLVAGPVQAAVESEVAKMPGYHPVDMVHELAAPMPAALRAKVEEAKRAVKEGDRAIATHEYDDACQRYQHAIDLLEEAGPAATVIQCADAYTRLGIALQYAGEDEPAKLAFRNAARFDQGKAVDGTVIDSALGGGLDRGRRAVTEGPVGTLSIVSNPPGARVWIDGVFRGTAPISVDSLPVGINHVKLDRPGAMPVVQLVEVKEAQDVPVRVQMKFTEETREITETLKQIPAALNREDGVPDMVKALGKRFRLERAVIATARMVKTNLTEVRMAIFDLPRGVRLCDEKGVFTVDAETGLQHDVAQWARGVIDRADRVRDRAAKDPLDRGDGTEDWYSTDHSRAKAKAAADADTGDHPKAGDDQTTADAAPAANKPDWEKSDYQPTPTKKKGSKSKDPLDGEDGTETW